MTNKEKFLQLVSPNDKGTRESVVFRKENRLWLRESQRIAVKVLLALKEQNLSQKDLAEKMTVSPQYVNKLVKGKENLTLDTITKLQEILQITILVTADKKKEENEYTVQAFSYQKEYCKEYSKYSSTSIKITA